MICLSTEHLLLAAGGKSLTRFLVQELTQQRYCSVVRDVQDLPTPKVESLQDGQSPLRHPSQS
jgi:hypothetical protein